MIPLILIDAALIGGLGVISLLSKDAFFFKLKPAIMEGMMVPWLLFWPWVAGGPALMQRYLQRYTLGATLNEQTMPLLRKMLGLMSILVAVHAVAVVLAALYLNRQSCVLYRLSMPFPSQPTRPIR